MDVEEENSFTSLQRALILECHEAPTHFLVPIVINSPHSQEFMVLRIFSVVLILLEPLMDEFTLIEVLKSKLV